MAACLPHQRSPSLLSVHRELQQDCLSLSTVGDRLSALPYSRHSGSHAAGLSELNIVVGVLVLIAFLTRLQSSPTCSFDLYLPVDSKTTP